MSVELEITLENKEQVKAALTQFPMELKQSVYTRFQRVANREEKILKSTTGFKDRTGHLRRSLAVVARWNPLSLEMGAYAWYAKYVAHGHGTWVGNWWNTYIRELMNRLPDDISQAVDRAVKAFNRRFR